MGVCPGEAGGCAGCKLALLVHDVLQPAAAAGGGSLCTIQMLPSPHTPPPHPPPAERRSSAASDLLTPALQQNTEPEICTCTQQETHLQLCDITV
ncbi:unnamed protein product [Pleuronectes platessa]|uniref:Uncharacterized protein n=1 Tax=Pleuronectes platessa TaxID=8262 RepID=A0A9N7Y5Y3_PLEPL|nr:unnamed protein product [Pleuronectes platessa]